MRLNENLAAGSMHMSALGKAAISRLQIWEELLAAPVCSWLLKKAAIRQAAESEV